MTVEETPCADSPDGIHCRHWYDGDACCYCAAPPMTDDEKRAHGMPTDD